MCPPNLKALGGTSDIFPSDSDAWQQLESLARHTAHLYGFREIRTPLIEEAAVFTGALGSTTEVVTKQMYQFEDRGGRRVVLRPEGTASIVRAFIEKGLDKTGGLVRLYYMGPMFRAERPQAGRRRQFHQFGAEMFGSASPYSDVETIAVLKRILDSWGLTGWKLKINSLGTPEDRSRILDFIRQKLEPHKDKFSPEELERLEKNPLRILDSKEPVCQVLCGAIDFSEVIADESLDRFDQVLRTLGHMDIPFERDPLLVRGLDYYTHTVFEVVHPALGAQDALGGGGRYDGLVQGMGGVSTTAVGFAIGLERVLIALEALKAVPATTKQPAVYVATTDPAEIPEGLLQAEQLRERSIEAVVNLEDRPLKRQFDQANKLGCRFVIVRGAAEREKKVVTVKDMNSREQRELTQADWLATMADLVKE